jgi:hypothetical protein
MSLERGEAVKTVVRVAFALSLIATMFAAVYAEDTPEEIHDKEIRLADEMASIVHDNQDNCDLMAGKLGRFMADHAAFLRKAQASTSEKDRQATEDDRARSRAARARMVDGLGKCHTSAKVTAAMQKHRALAPRAADDVWLEGVAQR